jgi:isocitrate dehydrogenase
MKYTEGAFMKWGYELVREEFPMLRLAGTTAVATRVIRYS